MQHPPRFWKHKESKEVIDHLTYSDLKDEHRANYDECDVTGEFVKGMPIDLDVVEKLTAIPEKASDLILPVDDAPVTTGTPVIEPEVTTDDAPVIDADDNTPVAGTVISEENINTIMDAAANGNLQIERSEIPDEVPTIRLHTSGVTPPEPIGNDNTLVVNPVVDFAPATDDSYIGNAGTAEEEI